MHSSFTRAGIEIDKQFRLFLSSKPDKSFPISLLKVGIKMTIESPRGLKNNLKQNFVSGGYVNSKLFDTDEFGPHWKRLVFSLGFIHALIHERKKFGPLTLRSLACSCKVCWQLIPRQCRSATWSILLARSFMAGESPTIMTDDACSAFWITSFASALYQMSTIMVITK